MRNWPFLRGFIVIAALVAACGGGGGGDDDSPPTALTLEVHFDGTAVSVVASRPLLAGESVHFGRPRRGNFGTIDCAPIVARNHPAVPIGADGTLLDGPAVDISLSTPLYQSQDWLTAEPTPQMLASLAGGTSAIIDMCVVKDGVTVEAREVELFEAWDASSSDPARHLHSPRAYAEACIDELGDIPFFAKNGPGDYGTYDCMNGTVVPMSVTDDSETVTFPTARVEHCDAPQYLDGRCEPGARVATVKNDLGTRWVMLCRKTDPALPLGHFNDIALVGHNPLSGKTCFFQNALYAHTDGTAIPHPADLSRSHDLWSGVQGGGGTGDGLDCASCHSADAWIHTPWIDGARDQTDAPVVPKIGVDLDYPLGATDAPYSLVRATQQGWTVPRQIVDEQANACLACHRLTEGRWLSWLGRLDGSDQAFIEGTTTPAYRSFARLHWMPPELTGLSESNWAISKYGLAIAFLEGCYQDPAQCTYAPIPTDPPLPTTGKLYEPVTTMTDAALALRAMQLIGGPVSGSEERCNECHGLTRSTLNGWLDLTTTALSGCLAEQVPAADAVACLRLDPASNASAFMPANAGIFAAAAHLGWFQNLFHVAYAADPVTGLEELAAFKSAVAMPRGNHPRFTQAELDIVATWFARGLPELDSVLPDDPPVEDCMPSISAALTEHVSTLATTGWSAKNRERNLRMFGCPDGAATTDCLTTYPDASAAAFSTDWPTGGSTIRILRQLSFDTSFWMRSSADGRFVANGGSPSRITDLERGFDIQVDASYDPGFFPDNSGFVFQGGGAEFCTQDLLESQPSHITFNEPQCRAADNVGLYQHLGAALSGTDYFAIAGQFESDAGGSGDTTAGFAVDSVQSLTPMINDGTHFVDHPNIDLVTPYEGDAILSPSTGLIISRRGGHGGEHRGYVVRTMTATPQGGTFVIDAPVVGVICQRGGKPAVSFDERFMVMHHYVALDEFASYGYSTAADPTWMAYVAAGTANLQLVDLSTGVATRITTMHAGQLAVFPHFRSDGWIYFLVMTPGGTEYIAASDAAVRLE
jgi:hypothetical protein